MQTELYGRFQGGNMKKRKSKAARSPIARAGKNRTAYARHDGKADVILDGSGSRRAKTGSLRYTWYLEGTPVARGMRPSIELPIGEHTITLVVNDGTEASQPSEVVITVVEPLQAECRIFPPYEDFAKKKPEIMVTLRLPPGITSDDVSMRQLSRLYPGGAEALHQYAMQWRVQGSVRVNIFAFFHVNLLKRAVRDHGFVEWTIAARLKTGRYVYGCDTVDPGDWSENIVFESEDACRHVYI
jgi:hypothetical protein